MIFLVDLKDSKDEMGTVCLMSMAIAHHQELIDTQEAF